MNNLFYDHECDLKKKNKLYIYSLNALSTLFLCVPFKSEHLLIVKTLDFGGKTKPYYLKYCKFHATKCSNSNLIPGF